MVFTESIPSSIYIPYPHYILFDSNIIELTDGSLITCGGETLKQWVIPSGTSTLELVGLFVGHTNMVHCVLDKDINTLISGSNDRTLKIWSKTTRKCLYTVFVGSQVRCLTKAKFQTTELVICGLGNGSVQIRRGNDLGLVSSFPFHTEAVTCIHELEDGSFVSGSLDGVLKRWNKEGVVLRSYAGVFGGVWGVVQLPNDVLVVASFDRALKVLQLTTGECLRSVSFSRTISGLVKLSSHQFASASSDGTIKVWNENVELLETMRSNHKDPIWAMTRLRDTVATFTTTGLIEIRQLKLRLPLVFFIVSGIWN